MTNSDSDSGLESTVLKLQSLQLQFANIMTQYKQAYVTYLSDITGSSGTTPKYNIVNGSVYFCKNCTQQDYIQTPTGQWPTANSATECEALCSTNSTCNGGTYQSSNKICWLTSSPTEKNGIYPGSYPDDTAIIPQNVQNAAVLQTLNQQLIDLNGQISTELASLEPIEQSDITSKNSQKGKIERSL